MPSYSADSKNNGSVRRVVIAVFFLFGALAYLRTIMIEVNFGICKKLIQKMVSKQARFLLR